MKLLEFIYSIITHYFKKDSDGVTLTPINGTPFFLVHQKNSTGRFYDTYMDIETWSHICAVMPYSKCAITIAGLTVCRWRNGVRIKGEYTSLMQKILSDIQTKLKAFRFLSKITDHAQLFSGVELTLDCEIDTDINKCDDQCIMNVDHEMKKALSVSHNVTLESWSYAQRFCDNFTTDGNEQINGYFPLCVSAKFDNLNEGHLNHVVLQFHKSVEYIQKKYGM